MTTIINADTSGGLKLTSDTSGALDIQSAGSTKLAIDSSGNVGIGTTAAATKLHIVDSLSGGQLLVANSESDNAVKYGTFGTQHYDTDQEPVLAISAESAASENNVLIGGALGEFNAATSIKFYTAANATTTGGTERMRIDSSGKVGIGTSPSYTLHVKGSVGIQGADDANEGGQIDFVGGTSYTGYGKQIDLYQQDLRFFGPNSWTASFFSTTGGQTASLSISGALSKGSGSFKIDHPLESKRDTHHLVHSFIEGPQADLIYRGKVDLIGGTATINIDTAANMTDGTFVLLNREVQCFTTNETGWTAIKGSVSGNILTITAQDNTCTDTISWMVIGERKDPHMYGIDWTDSDGKVITEPLKPEEVA